MKKVFKKAISILLVAVMVFGAAPLAGFVGVELPKVNLFGTKVEAATEYTSGNFTYTISGGVATITGGNCYGSVVIPSTVNGYPVRYIGDSAFQDNRNITSVTIPSSVRTIGAKSFESCSLLKSVAIENGTTVIDVMAFFGSAVETVEIPSTVTTIGTMAFNYASDLKEVTIPASVTKIGYMAFAGSGLKTVYYNAADCEATGDSSALPPFMGCESLTKIVLGNTVREIGSYMFMDCENVTSIDMHAGITSTGYDSFKDCTKLSTINFYGYDTDFNSISGSFTGALDVLKACKINYIHDEHRGVLTSTTATCNEGGISSFKCCCGYSYKEKVDALGHDYKSVVTKPLCTSQGYTTHTCSRCGDNYIDSYVAEIGHNYIATVTEPDCTNPGYITYRCPRCRDTYTEYTDAKGHNYETIVTPPSCYEKGYTTHTCSVCGYSFVDSYVDAGHKYESVVTPPISCTEQGYTTHTCSVCGDSYVDSYVEGEHDYSKIMYHDISTSFNVWSNQKDCEKNDAIRYECSHCLDTKIEYIEPKQHELELPAGFDPDVEYPYDACVWDGAKCKSCNCTVRRTWDSLSTVHHHSNKWGGFADDYYTLCDWCGNQDRTDVKRSVYIELDESILSDDGYWHITNGSSIPVDDIKFKIIQLNTIENFEGGSETYTFTHDITDEYSDLVSVEVVAGAEHINNHIIDCPYGGVAISVRVKFDYYPNGLENFTASDPCFTVSSQNIHIYVDRRVFLTKWHTYYGTYETPFVEGTYDYISRDYYLYDDPAYQEYGYQWATDWIGLPVPAAPKGYTFEKWSFSDFGYEAPSHNIETTAVYTPTALQINNNPSSRKINYGETLRLSTDFEPQFGERICWYVDGKKMGEGKSFNVSFEGGTKTVEVIVILIDRSGNVLRDANGNTISDSETVTVNDGFFQKIISFFKNLFGMNRTIVQAFKGIY